MQHNNRTNHRHAYTHIDFILICNQLFVFSKIFVFFLILSFIFFFTRLVPLKATVETRLLVISPTMILHFYNFLQEKYEQRRRSRRKKKRSEGGRQGQVELLEEKKILKKVEKEHLKSSSHLIRGQLSSPRGPAAGHSATEASWEILRVQF